MSDFDDRYDEGREDGYADGRASGMDEREEEVVSLRAKVERLTKLLDTARGMLIYASGIPAAKHVFADEFMEDVAAFIRNRTAGQQPEVPK